jgi:hypothetical protein
VFALATLLAAGPTALAQKPSHVVALAGYYTPDGFQHAIVATANGQVLEVYFSPAKGIFQDVLAQF